MNRPRQQIQSQWTAFSSPHLHQNLGFDADSPLLATGPLLRRRQMVRPTHANAHAGSDGFPCLLPPLPRPDVHHPSFIGLYSLTMMDELREFFDQFYRLHTLRCRQVGLAEPSRAHAALVRSAPEGLACTLVMRMAIHPSRNVHGGLTRPGPRSATVMAQRRCGMRSGARRISGARRVPTWSWCSMQSRLGI